MLHFISINPLYKSEEDTLLKPNAFKSDTSIKSEFMPKRKQSKKRVSFEDIEAAGKRGNENFNYFLEHGKLPFSR